MLVRTHKVIALNSILLESHTFPPDLYFESIQIIEIFNAAAFSKILGNHVFPFHDLNEIREW